MDSTQHSGRLSPWSSSSGYRLYLQGAGHVSPRRSTSAPTRSATNWTKPGACARKPRSCWPNTSASARKPKPKPTTSSPLPSARPSMLAAEAKQQDGGICRAPHRLAEQKITQAETEAVATSVPVRRRSRHCRRRAGSSATKSTARPRRAVQERARRGQAAPELSGGAIAIESGRAAPVSGLECQCVAAARAEADAGAARSGPAMQRHERCRDAAGRAIAGMGGEAIAGIVRARPSPSSGRAPPWRRSRPRRSTATAHRP